MMNPNDPEAVKQACLCGADACIGSHKLLAGYTCVRDVGMKALAAPPNDPEAVREVIEDVSEHCDECGKIIEPVNIYPSRWRHVLADNESYTAQQSMYPDCFNKPRPRSKLKPSPTTYRKKYLVDGSKIYEPVEAVRTPADPRMKFIDYDARPKSKTNQYCIMCQKDIKTGSTYRKVFANSNMMAILPDDVERYECTNSDGTWQIVGLDCARRLGMEWTVKSHG